MYFPNPLGIYDMHGNVWEWTSSEEGLEPGDPGRVLEHPGAYCTAAYRDWCQPIFRSNRVGFRILAVQSV